MEASTNHVSHGPSADIRVISCHYASTSNYVQQLSLPTLLSADAPTRNIRMLPDPPRLPALHAALPRIEMDVLIEPPRRLLRRRRRIEQRREEALGNLRVFALFRRRVVRFRKHLLVPERAAAV